MQMPPKQDSPASTEVVMFITLPAAIVAVSIRYVQLQVFCLSYLTYFGDSQEQPCISDLG